MNQKAKWRYRSAFRRRTQPQASNEAWRGGENPFPPATGPGLARAGPGWAGLGWADARRDRMLASLSDRNLRRIKRPSLPRPPLFARCVCTSGPAFAKPSQFGRSRPSSKWPEGKWSACARAGPQMTPFSLAGGVDRHRWR